ncbi:nucleotidyltransferase family protein [Pseudomonas sp. CR3202]|uniref:nucleotidyltransferase family protein n=1 Tax=Pseudomonas sp. CR3202 TaxID=3351532 RepID=UPI003BF37E0D
MSLISQVQTIIAGDPVRWRILQLVQELELPDCWVAAGFVRSAVWDHLHQRSASPLPADIDVIWFDCEQTSRELDARLESILRRKDHRVNWSVKNQAHMHLRNDDLPYASATDAMTCWPETATAVAVRLGVNGEIEVAAPLGLDDLFNLVVRPTTKFQAEKRQVYQDRLRSKNWLATWPGLKLFETW